MRYEGICISQYRLYGVWCVLYESIYIRHCLFSRNIQVRLQCHCRPSLACTRACEIHAHVFAQQNLDMDATKCAVLCTPRAPRVLYSCYVIKAKTCSEECKEVLWAYSWCIYVRCALCEYDVTESSEHLFALHLVFWSLSILAGSTLVQHWLRPR